MSTNFFEKQSLAFVVPFKNCVVAPPFAPEGVAEPPGLTLMAKAYFTGVRFFLEMPLVVSYRDGVRMERHRDFKEARKEGYQPIAGNPLRWGIYGYVKGFCREASWGDMSAAMVDREDFEAFTLDQRINHIKLIRWLVSMTLDQMK